MMHHKSDNKLNKQIQDLNKIRIPVSEKKIMIVSAIYILLAPLLVFLSIKLSNTLLLYIYLLPFVPVIAITYIIFTGKLKWVIRLLHKVLKTPTTV